MHIDPDIMNTLEPRTNWVICMGPTGNLQGSYKFLSLVTGKKVTQRKFMEMPRKKSVLLAKHNDTNIPTMMEPFSSSAAWF